MLQKLLVESCSAELYLLSCCNLNEIRTWLLFEISHCTRVYTNLFECIFHPFKMTVIIEARKRFLYVYYEAMDFTDTLLQLIRKHQLWILYFSDMKLKLSV